MLVRVGFDMEKGIFEEGIGLATMRERVQILKGDFAVESQPGKGTRIAVTIPVGS